MNLKIIIIAFFCIILNSCYKTVTTSDSLLKNGRYKVYDEKGKLCSKGKILNGKKRGEWMYFIHGKLYKIVEYNGDDTILKTTINVGDR